MYYNNIITAICASKKMYYTDDDFHFLVFFIPYAYATENNNCYCVMFAIRLTVGATSFLVVLFCAPEL